jgi:prepilin signal peptidase PulO-like enzyme (type II secretory pathway)
MNLLPVIIVAIYGLFLGSFLNVLADRLPREDDVISGRSRCEKCRKSLRWWELIPIFSYFFLRGRCARCHTPLSLKYPLTELLSAAMFTWLWMVSQGDLVTFALSSIAAACLFVIFFADLSYEIIPDSMVFIGSLASLALQLYRSGLSSLVPYPAAGFGALTFFYFLYLVTRGRGMGFGDVKLVFFLGLLTGFPGIVIALYAAFLTGAAVGVILVLIGKKRLKSHVPFGPFLVGGTVFALIYGHQVISWWKGVV